MKYLKQFLIIIAFAFAGEILHRFIPLPVPASIYGIVLLFLALETGIVKVHQIRETGNFLIELMPIMFLPPAVGVIESWELLRISWLPYLLVMAISTVVVMVLSGLATQAVIRRKRRNLK